MEEKVEIKEVSEREILVGKNKLYFGEDNILYITVLGDIDDEISMKIKEASDKFTAMAEGKLNLLVDLNKTGIPSADARKKGLEGFEGEKIGKIAFWGLHPVARVIASFMMDITKKEDIRFFKTREEALDGLRARILDSEENEKWKKKLKSGGMRKRRLADTWLLMKLLMI